MESNSMSKVYGTVYDVPFVISHRRSVRDGHWMCDRGFNKVNTTPKLENDSALTSFQNTGGPDNQKNLQSIV